MVQVISFQMGQKLPPGTQPIPRLRPDLHGLFTVNLGVAIEEAWLMGRRDQTVQFPPVLNDYDCEIRERLGQILGNNKMYCDDIARAPHKRSVHELAGYLGIDLPNPA